MPGKNIGYDTGIQSSSITLLDAIVIIPVLERLAKDGNEEVKEAANYLIEELKE